MPEPDSAARLEFAAASNAERAQPATADEQELIQLFDELRNPLLRYLAALGLAVQDGEEVIQEVFLALFQHLRRGRSRQNLRGWIFRVAHNLGLKRRLAEARETGGDAWEREFAGRPDPAENPEQQFLSGQRIERLRAVLGTLSEQDRCCLSLRAEGLSYREIAEVLGMSLGSVAASLGRSLGRFSRVEGV